MAEVQAETVQSPIGAPASNPLPLTSLYVGDLDPNVTDSQLYDVFSQVVEVVSVRVCRDITTRRSLGYAYVNFTNPTDAARALDLLNFTPLNNKPIRIMYSNGNISTRTSAVANIFIKNLDKSIDNKELHDTFSAFGNVLSCKIATDPSGQSKGYGYVQFDQEETAQNAIDKLNGMALNDKVVYVGSFLRKQERENAVDNENKEKFSNVFVKNLSESTTEKDLSKVFGEYGQITSSVVMREEDGKSKCFGFVNFLDPDKAARAIQELNGKKFDDREWYVEKTVKKSERERELKGRFEQGMKEVADKYQGVNLYLKNLDDSIGDDRLRELFSTFGTITSCKVMRDPNGISNGSGFVAFSAPEDASRAALTGTILRLLHGLLVKLSPNEFLSQDVYGDMLSMCVSNQQFIVALTGTFLRLLHGLLVKLSPNEFLSQDVYGGMLSLCVSNQQFIVEIKYTDIIDLSNLLYDKLHKQFEWLIFGTSYLPSMVVSGENGCITADAKFSPVEFLLLLRCSMIILQFLAFNLTLVLERCQILVALLEKLCLPNSPLQFCHVDAASEAGISINFSSAIREVFLDEFLLHHDLKEYFIMTGCARATEENLFLSRSLGEVQVITEVVSSHFLLAVYDGSAFERFISSLSWSNEVHDQIPALGLGSSLALLSHPVMFSAPYLMQAHVILLASRCIGIHMPTDAKKLDELEMKPYILAFELSVKLYSGFIPNLNFFNCIHRDEIKSSFCAKGQTFNSYTQSLTYDKIVQQIDRLIHLCHLPSYGLHSGTRAEILDKSIAYIKGNQNLIDETCRDEACSILTCIVKSILLREGELLYEDKESIHHEMCCVAAVLKLMSSALLQIGWYVGQKGYSGGMRTSKHLLFCKKYDFISEIIHSFGNYGGNRHIQKILFGAIESCTGRQQDIKLMFSHFASLLSYSFTNRVDFLWKGCIFMMIPLMNLLVIEEGNLEAFRPLLRKIKEDTFPHTSQDLFHEPSSIKIAANIKKVRDQIKCRQHEDHSMGDQEITEAETPDGKSNASNTFQTNCEENRDNTCTADIFFKSLRGSQSKQAEWEDLGDFVTCTPLKDYSNWLKKRAKFRKWKYEKMSFMKQNIRKSTRKRRVGSNFAYFR